MTGPVAETTNTAQTAEPADAVPQVEHQIVVDMIKRALPAIPVLVLAAALWRGADGAASAAYAVALVLANFAAAASLLGWAARISPAALMGAALFGYLGRLGLITVAVLVVKDQAWVDLVALGTTIIVTHLGLLAWETRYVSASLAYPALKPSKERS